MIIIGYPGIGKTSLAGRNNCIDLESGNFWHNDKRPDNWVVYYCNIAEDLSKQGYVVFVSSHEAVRTRLQKYSNEKIICIYPALSLKNEWINKLHIRWQITKTTKDFKAYDNVNQYYDKQIQALIDCGLPTHELTSMDYSLNKIILNYKKEAFKERVTS